MTLIGNNNRSRLINAGTFVVTRVSIDDHTLTVLEADGVGVEPVHVSSVDLGVGQRYSVLVTRDQQPGAYWIRSTIDITAQARYYGPGFTQTTFGVLRYAGTEPESVPSDYTDVPDPTPLDANNLAPADKLDADLPHSSVLVKFGMQYVSSGQHLSEFKTWSYL